MQFTNASSPDLERQKMLEAMQAAANGFYAKAVHIGNHPFIEFAGLMNEYITACRGAAEKGVDFSMCSVHSGRTLPLHPHQVDYINEKLECIFTGRSVMSVLAVESGDGCANGEPAAVRLCGELITVGDLSLDDIPFSAEEPSAQIRLPNGRVITLIGLTREEARTVASNFGLQVSIKVDAVASAELAAGLEQNAAPV